MSKGTMRRAVLAGLLLLWLAPAAPGEQTTVAVLEVGRPGQVPAGVMDLLQAQLAEQPDVRLVERAQVRRLLDEQALAQAQGAYWAEAVRLGRITAADVFLLVERIESHERGDRGVVLRLRLVESRHGLKIADSALVIDDGAMVDGVGQIARWTARHLERLPQVQREPVLVGVSAFVSLEISPRWNWLSDALARGLEQQLAGQAGMVLLERSWTWPLVQERLLAEGLPEALTASMLLIEGTFELDRERGLDAVVVTLRARRGAEVVFERRFEGSTEATGELTDAVAAAVVEGLGMAAGAPFDRQAEVQVLLEQARAYARMGEPRMAAAPLEAAVALAPEMIEPKVMLIVVSRPPLVIGAARGEERQRYLNEVVPDAFRSLALAEQVLSRSDRWQTGSANTGAFGHRERIMPIIGGLFNSSALVCRALGDGADSLRLATEMREILHPLFARYRTEAERQRDRHYGSMLHTGLWNGQWWSHSPEEYYALLREMLEKSHQGEFVEGRNFTAGIYMRTAEPPFWRDHPRLHELHLEFLAEMREHPRALLRATALMGAARYYARTRVDAEQARMHYEAFVELMISDIIPNRPELENTLAIWSTDIINSGLSGVVDRLTLGRLHAQLAEAMFERGWVQDSNSWESVVRSATGLLESAGKPEEAEALLELAVRKGVRSGQPRLEGWLQELRSRHPDLKPVEERVRAVRFEAQPVLHLDQMQDVLRSAGKTDLSRMRRLVSTDSGLAVVVGSPLARREQMALVRLEAGAVRPIAAQVHPTPITLDSRLANTSMSYGRWGPAAVADGETVFVGMPDAGLLIFAPGRPVESITEETGLPSNNIRRLVVMNGRLYMSVGDGVRGNALVEMDLATRTSRIILSHDGGGLLHGRSIINLLADPEQQVLWLMLGSDRGGVSSGIFRFDPRTRESTRRLEFGDLTELFWLGDRLFMRGSSWVGTLEPEAEGRPQWLLATPHAGVPETRLARWQFRLSLGPTVLVEDGFVSIATEPGRSSGLYWFSEEHDGPVRVEGPGVPAASDILGMMGTEDGLLLMTGREVVRLAELRTPRPARDQAPAEE